MTETEATSVSMDTGLRGLAQRGYRPSVIFDVGASDGSWARHARQFWPEATIICFEPLLERRAALEALQAEAVGAVKAHFVGLGDEEAELSLGVSDSLWESSFAYGGSQARMVQVRTLNNMYSEGLLPAPSMIKLDVQGFERRVLLGGGDVLQHANVVLMECSFFPFCAEMGTIDETIGFMAERGFMPYEFMDFMRRPLDGAMGQCDILFVRKTDALVADVRWG